MASGTRRLQVTIAAGTTNANILTGEALEFPGVASQVEIYGIVVAAGFGSLFCDVQFGTDLVAENVIIPSEGATAGVGPIVPDHLLVVDALAPSDRLIIRVRNADAVNDRAVTFLVRVQPV